MTTEHDHLAVAIRHIVSGEARVRQQRELVDRLAQHGHDTVLAQTVLDTMQTSLQQMQEHRQMIERAIAGGRK